MKKKRVWLNGAWLKITQSRDDYEGVGFELDFMNSWKKKTQADSHQANCFLHRFILEIH